jgi:FkbM family methyltransferase
MSNIYQSRQPFKLLRRLADFFVRRYLARRGRQFLTEGNPPLAVFAHDFIGQEVMLQGRFEKEELDVLFDFLKPLANVFSSQAAIDIGANIGNHSHYFAPHFARVSSFEPNPRTFSLLSANAALCKNITVHQHALGDMPGQLPLSYSSGNVGEATLVATAGVSKEQSVIVDILRLDDCIEPGIDVGLIKIDVEGFEEKVLLGATRALANLPIIIFEQNLTAFEDGRSQTAEHLQHLGYRLFLLSKRNVGGVINLLRKMAQGVQYDVVEVDQLMPGHYSMVLALNAHDISQLRARRV